MHVAREVEVLVVGAGPAGVEAARVAAQHGVQTVLVDDNPIDTALVERNIPYWYGSRARQLASSSWFAPFPVVHPAAEFMQATNVWGVFTGYDSASFHDPPVASSASRPAGTSATVVGLYDGRATSLVRAQQLILATGAGDLYLAFPGWTRGGVLGGLGALHLLDTFGHLQASRMLILGSGNLALEVARRAMSLGVLVVGIVEIGDRVLGDRSLAATLREAGVPFHFNHVIRSADGRADVEEVRLAAVDANGALRAESEVAIAADSLCVAIGRVPAIELPALAGCPLEYDAAGGGQVARSRHGVLVAGDVAGASDTEFLDPTVAALSGARAAEQAVVALGRRPDTFSHSWNVSSPRPSPSFGVYTTEWHRLVDSVSTDDTIVCRCEEITRGQVLQAVAESRDAHPDEIKRLSRAGMGVCQGRGCRPIVAGLIAAATSRPFANVPLSSFRPPVRPLPLGALAAEDDPPVPACYVLFKPAETRLAEDARAGRLAPLALMRFQRAALEAAYRCFREGLSDAEVEAVAGDLEQGTRETEQRSAPAR